MTEHELEISVEANACAACVMPEPKSTLWARSDRITSHELLSTRCE